MAENLVYSISGSALQFGPNTLCREYELDILGADLAPTGGKVRCALAIPSQVLVALAAQLALIFAT